MKALKRSERKRTWAPRSQRSYREQWRHEDDLRRCESTISVSEKSIVELEKRLESAVASTATGRDSGGKSWLVGRISDLEVEKKELRLYKKHQTALRSKINGLHPSPSQASERAKQQNVLFRLASERLKKKDRLIASAVDELRQLLQARRKAGAEMRAVAQKIDLSLASDGLDESRFDSLLASLPADLISASEQWFHWFVGEEQKTKIYEVQHESLILPETLANCHAYRRGDRVAVSEDQAAPFVSGNDPSMVEPGSWPKKKPEFTKIEILQSVEVSEVRRIGHIAEAQRFEPGVYVLPTPLAERILRMDDVRRVGTHEVGLLVARICEEDEVIGEARPQPCDLIRYMQG